MRLGRAIVAANLGLLAPAHLARATDLDVALSDTARRAAVAPDCAGAAGKHAAAPAAQYRRGLCLLYGIGAPVQRARAVLLLRAAAAAGLPDAQLALADTLQDGAPPEQAEALDWYARAEAGGDARAGLRRRRLAERLTAPVAGASDGAIPEPPPGTIVDPPRRDLPKLYRDGYHCHVMVFGQSWCHTTVD